MVAVASFFSRWASSQINRSQDPGCVQTHNEADNEADNAAGNAAGNSADTEAANDVDNEADIDADKHHERLGRARQDETASSSEHKLRDDEQQPAKVCWGAGRGGGGHLVELCRVAEKGLVADDQHVRAVAVPVCSPAAFQSWQIAETGPDTSGWDGGQGMVGAEDRLSRKPRMFFSTCGPLSSGQVRILPASHLFISLSQLPIRDVGQTTITFFAIGP